MDFLLKEFTLSIGKLFSPLYSDISPPLPPLQDRKLESSGVA